MEAIPPPRAPRNSVSFPIDLSELLRWDLKSEVKIVGPQKFECSFLVGAVLRDSKKPKVATHLMQIFVIGMWKCGIVMSKSGKELCCLDLFARRMFFRRFDSKSSLNIYPYFPYCSEVRIRRRERMLLEMEIRWIIANFKILKYTPATQTQNNPSKTKHLDIMNHIMNHSEHGKGAASGAASSVKHRR